MTDTVRDIFLAFVRVHVLHHATHERIYGAGMSIELARHGYRLPPGTLYPLLRRLETQGLLKSEWRIVDGPPRRYYSLTTDGRKLLKKLTESWQAMNEAMGRLLKEVGQ